jgi:hypothetical protein
VAYQDLIPTLKLYRRIRRDLQAKLLNVGEKGFYRLGSIIQEKDLAYFHETSLPMEVALFQLFAALFS